MTFDEWLKIGYDHAFCGPPVCYLHNGIGMTASEEEDDMENLEPCVFVVRLYDDLATKKAVEANHSPSVWRAVELGWIS